MISPRHPATRHRRAAFTLVELLVVIAIIAVLAMLSMIVLRTGMRKAAAAKALDGMRQSGSILLAAGQEQNGRLQYYGGATEDGGDDGGNDDKAVARSPYNIVRSSLDLGLTDKPSDLCEIMHWDARRVKPKVYHINCYGVNFTDVPDFGIEWVSTMVVDKDSSYNLRTLSTLSAKRPEAYPLLLDSSTDRGDEIFRILEKNGDCVGLRNSGKANAFFLDGSSRALDRPELKKAGFSRAYDNSTTPPKALTL